jgi:hypothetical protein
MGNTVNGKRKLATYARHFLEKSPQPPFARGGKGGFCGEILEGRWLID